jgi:hypothetical protein
MGHASTAVVDWPHVDVAVVDWPCVDVAVVDWPYVDVAVVDGARVDGTRVVIDGPCVDGCRRRDTRRWGTRRRGCRRRGYRRRGWSTWLVDVALVDVAGVVVPLLLLVHLSSSSLLLGWPAVEVDGRDVAGRRAPMGLVTWRRRGRLTGVVVDAGVVDVAWSTWRGRRGGGRRGGGRRGRRWWGGRVDGASRAVTGLAGVDGGGGDGMVVVEKRGRVCDVVCHGWQFCQL